MIWFRLRTLERILINENLSEKAGSNYLLVLIIFVLSIIYLPGFSGYSNEWYYLAEYLIILATLVFTCNTALSINNKSAAKDFLKRLLSLSVVLGLRLGIFFTLLHLLYKIIMFIIPIDFFIFFERFTTGDLPNLIFTTIIFLSFSFLLIRSFTRINLDSANPYLFNNSKNEF